MQQERTMCPPLAYTVPGEAWYASALPEADTSELTVCAPAHTPTGTPNGVRWEFAIRAVDVPALELVILEDAWPAFTDVPALFAALAAPPAPTTLAQVRTVLDRLGATDITPRQHPSGGPGEAASCAG